MTDVERAREAYRRRDWATAAEGFTAAQAEAAASGRELSADDLFELADASWWLGRADRSVDAGEAAYRRFLDGDRPERAAMAAMTVAVNLLMRGDVTLGSAWTSRAVRLVEDRPDSVEHHYLRYLTEVEALVDQAGTLPDVEAEALVARALDIQQVGLRTGDANLTATGAVAAGRVLLRRGEAARATRLLDEAMLCVLSEDLAPDWAGNVYCHLMAACHEVGDLARARDWTDATERWLATLPEAVLFRGICRVHRSQLLQTLGAWDRAEAEAAHVCVDLAEIAPGTAAEGHYLLGELRRLRGDLTGAEEAYLRAHSYGRDPQPGLALLRLLQGRVDDARADLRAAVVARGHERLACVPVWTAQVRVALAAGDLGEAEEACRCLEDAAATYRTVGFECEALGARGAVELAAGRTEASLPVLREACRRWRAVGADHDAALVCLLLAEAYRRLGAQDAADLEDAAARAVLGRLGAVPRALIPPDLPAQRGLPDGLTAREAQVLAAVAQGAGNREVARALVISEKTVARHLSNIYTKIGVASRTEAAAYAFRHGLDGSDDPRAGTRMHDATDAWW